MATDDRTDRFRPVFEPEDIFDRFVRNANASTEDKLPRVRDDEPTGRVAREQRQRPTLAERENAKRLEDAERAKAEAARARERAEVARAAQGSAPGSAQGAAQRPADSRPAPPEAASAVEAPPGVPPVPERKPWRGGPPKWDQEITVRAPGLDEDEDEGTRPDAPMPLAMARAFSGERPDYDDDSGELEVDEEIRTMPRASPLTTDSGQRILLLTRVKRPGSGMLSQSDSGSTRLMGSASALRPPSEESTTPAARVSAEVTRVGDIENSPLGVGEQVTRVAAVVEDSTTPALEAHAIDVADAEAAAVEAKLAAGRQDSVVSARGQHQQRLEAARVVPDVEALSQHQDVTFVGEGIEDGQMPTRQLDQILSDMAVLLRYGHAGQVRERLDGLRRTYPDDLLLLRRIAEFHVEHEQTGAAMETLFVLSGALFERRNVEGMRQALEQVLLLEPGNPRAYRLLGLLERRPDGTVD